MLIWVYGYLVNGFSCGCIAASFVEFASLCCCFSLCCVVCLGGVCIVAILPDCLGWFLYLILLLGFDDFYGLCLLVVYFW